jgi:CheY-like chemotaxis protein
LTIEPETRLAMHRIEYRTEHRTELAPRTEPISVLLVEDEVLISHLVAEYLCERGFAVHEVATADEALRYIDNGGRVDVMFTDINLPGAMNGAELAQRARKRNPELPIVYASGRYGSADFAGRVPDSIFVPKPYDPEDLCTLIARLTAN